MNTISDIWKIDKKLYKWIILLKRNLKKDVAITLMFIYFNYN